MRTVSTKSVRPAPIELPVPSSTPAGDLPTTRQTLLHDAPLLLGGAWARALSESLHGEGRPVDGGWPGTTQEARARVLQHFHRELARMSLSPLLHDESEAATTATYEQARSAWLELVRVARRGRRKGDAG